MTFSSSTPRFKTNMCNQQCSSHRRHLLATANHPAHVKSLTSSTGPLRDAFSLVARGLGIAILRPRGLNSPPPTSGQPPLHGLIFNLSVPCALFTNPASSAARDTLSQFQDSFLCCNTSVPHDHSNLLASKPVLFPRDPRVVSVGQRSSGRRSHWPVHHGPKTRRDLDPSQRRPFTAQPNPG